MEFNLNSELSFSKISPVKFLEPGIVPTVIHLEIFAEKNLSSILFVKDVPFHSVHSVGGGEGGSPMKSYEKFTNNKVKRWVLTSIEGIIFAHSSLENQGPISIIYSKCVLIRRGDSKDSIELYRWCTLDSVSNTLVRVTYYLLE